MSGTMGLGMAIRGRLVAPTLPCDFDPYPVNDGLMISSGSSINNGPPEYHPHLGRRELFLEEHTQVGIWEVYGFVETHGIDSRVFK